MKIVIEYDRCASNAVCMGIAPEIFEVRDDDMLYLLDAGPDESKHKLVRVSRSAPASWSSSHHSRSTSSFRRVTAVDAIRQPPDVSAYRS